MGRRVAVDVDALKRERQRKMDEAGDIMTTANQETPPRPLTADEQAHFDTLMRDAKNLRRQYQSEEEMRAEEGVTDTSGQPVTRPDPRDAPNYVGMTREDVKQFSIRRLIAVKAGLIPTSEAKLELEISEQVARRNGGVDDSRTAHVPFEVTSGIAEHRDILISAEGADIKETTLQPVIELLRNKMIVRAAGATVITGLQGDILFPKHSGADNNANWVAEATDHAERTQTFGQLLMQPKQLGSFTEISRKTLLQSSFDMEVFIRNELATTLAVELDRAALHGTGAPEPTGVLATAGIGAVTLATSGSSAISWSHVVQLETEVAQDNADVGALAYITNTKVRGALKTREKVAATGLFIWQDPANVSPAQPGSPLNGYNAFVTNQVSSALTKGTGTGLSAIFFGNWSELLMGIWSDLTIVVDPFTKAPQGTVRVINMLNADVGVRHPESFAACSDIFI